jgi:hypothetical protein
MQVIYVDLNLALDISKYKLKPKFLHGDILYPDRYDFKMEEKTFSEYQDYVFFKKFKIFQLVYSNFGRANTWGYVISMHPEECKSFEIVIYKNNQLEIRDFNLYIREKSTTNSWRLELNENYKYIFEDIITKAEENILELIYI